MIFVNILYNFCITTFLGGKIQFKKKKLYLALFFLCPVRLAFTNTLESIQLFSKKRQCRLVTLLFKSIFLLLYSPPGNNVVQYYFICKVFTVWFAAPQTALGPGLRFESGMGDPPHYTICGKWWIRHVATTITSLKDPTVCAVWEENVIAIDDESYRRERKGRRCSRGPYLNVALAI